VPGSAAPQHLTRGLAPPRALSDAPAAWQASWGPAGRCGARCGLVGAQEGSGECWREEKKGVASPLCCPPFYRTFKPPAPSLQCLLSLGGAGSRVVKPPGLLLADRLPYGKNGIGSQSGWLAVARACRRAPAPPPRPARPSPTPQTPPTHPTPSGCMPLVAGRLRRGAQPGGEVRPRTRL
jgi:hypothetical protein